MAVVCTSVCLVPSVCTNILSSQVTVRQVCIFWCTPKFVADVKTEPSKGGGLGERKLSFSASSLLVLLSVCSCRLLSLDPGVSLGVPTPVHPGWGSASAPTCHPVGTKTPISKCLVHFYLTGAQRPRATAILWVWILLKHCLLLFCCIKSGLKLGYGYLTYDIKSKKIV